MIFISERGFTLRIGNSGTAPLTASRAIFDGQPTRIVSVSFDMGAIKEGSLSLLPGDLGEVTFRPSFSGISGVFYPFTIVTESGKRHDTDVCHP